RGHLEPVDSRCPRSVQPSGLHQTGDAGVQDHQPQPSHYELQRGDLGNFVPGAETTAVGRCTVYGKEGTVVSRPDVCPTDSNRSPEGTGRKIPEETGGRTEWNRIPCRRALMKSITPNSTWTNRQRTKRSLDTSYTHRSWRPRKRFCNLPSLW